MQTKFDRYANSSYFGVLTCLDSKELIARHFSSQPNAGLPDRVVGSTIHNDGARVQTGPAKDGSISLTSTHLVDFVRDLVFD